MERSSICLLPNLEGVGGPASFYARFKEGLQVRGIPVHSNPSDSTTAASLIIGGTRHLEWIIRMRSKGVKLVQRLDGMNWIHRKRHTGIKHFIRSEINNFMLAAIRRSFVDDVVYQSGYVLHMWHRIYGTVTAPSHLIYNGVNLSQFTPDGFHQRPGDHIRLLVVEGRLRGGHEVGLENAVYLAQCLGQKIKSPVELMVVSDVEERERRKWDQYGKVWINWRGIVPREKIAEIDRSAHIYFSAEINAPCPNSVIEAMACGLPVVSFATGSLPELVKGNAGKLVEYGSGYNDLKRPDIPALTEAAEEIIDNQQQYRMGARENAVANFNIEHVIDEYLHVLLG